MRRRSSLTLSVAAALLLASCSSSVDTPTPLSAGTPGGAGTEGGSATTTGSSSTGVSEFGTASPTSSGASLVSGGSVTFGLASDPGNLDPWSSLSSTNVAVALFGYDTLVSIDQKGKAISALAKSWKQAGLKWTFTLNEGITCADGSALDAELVATNVNWAADPKNKSPMAGLYMPASAKAKADKAANTVEITLPAPSPFFLQGLYAFPIICKKGMDDRKSMRTATQGSGPYVLTEAKPNDHYTYTLREGYTWGPEGATTTQEGMPKTVTFKVVANETTMANLLLSKEVNIASVPGPDRKRLEQAGLYHFDVLSPYGEFFFNQKKELPMASVELRKAMVMAVDLAQLNKVFSSGTGVQPTQLQLFAVTCPTNSVQYLPQHDPEGAKGLLDAAGWVPGGDGIRVKDGKPLALTLVYDTGSPQLQAAAELSVAQWKAIGVKVTATATDVIGGALFGTATWDMAWQGVGTLNPAQLVPFFSGPAPTDGNNFAHTDNAEYNKLTADAMKLPAEKGCKLWNDAEASLLKNVNLAPFSLSTAPTWGTGVTFTVTAGQVRATSLRQTG